MSKIAAEIGRHRSTVYREIKRNYFNDEELPYLKGYYGMNAQKYVLYRRARRRKLIRLKVSPNNWHVICPADVRNGDHATPDGPEVRFSRRIGPSMNALTM